MALSRECAPPPRYASDMACRRGTSVRENLRENLRARRSGALDAPRHAAFDPTGLASGALVGTVAMTALMEWAQARRVTRMSLPFLLGTMVTERRSLVRIWGTLLHLFNGLLFASGYGLIFERTERANWRIGAGIGALHGLVVLVALLPIIQEVHPRMAEEDEGPDPTPLLEPPGFLGSHYGLQTPLVAMIGHVVYGSIVGAMYRSAGSRLG